MSLINEINKELQEYAFIEDEKKIIGKKLLEFDAEIDVDLKLASLLLTISMSRMPSWKTFRKYFPKKGGEQYAIAVYRHIKRLDEKALQLHLENNGLKGDDEEKYFINSYNIDKEWVKAFFICGLTDKDPQIIMFSLIVLKALIQEIDEVLARKIYILYAVPSFRKYIDFFCADTNIEENIVFLSEIYACNIEQRNFVTNLIRDHKVDEKYPSVRDYILSKDTSHAVDLPLDYFNHIIFDENYCNWDIATKGGFSDLFHLEDIPQEVINEMSRLVKEYFYTPTMKNLRELNIFVNEHVPFERLGSIILKEYKIILQENNYEISRIFQLEESLVRLYLNSTSLICAKAAACVIGAGCTYRPYFSVFYKEFEQLAACEDFATAALIACQAFLDIDRKRLEILFKEFKQFGKLLLVDFLPKETATEKGFIYGHAFENNEYPQLMAKRLLNESKFSFQKKLLGEEGFSIVEAFFVHKLVANFLDGGMSMAISQSDFFILIDSYVQLYPESYYSKNTMRKAIDIFEEILTYPEKKVQGYWEKYSHKKAKELLLRLQKLAV